jgi:hypothetical protein
MIHARKVTAPVQGIDPGVILTPTANLTQQYVMQPDDAARRTGFEKIHFVAPPVLDSKLG